jgi:hypothetical protein
MIDEQISRRLTLPQFFSVMGGYLKEERLRRHWNLVDVQYHGGPNYATVEQHEKGQIRTFAKLQTHLRVFDAELLDVMCDIVKALMTGVNQISADAVEGRRLLQQYRHTTPDGREALRRVAAVLPYVQDETVSPAELTAGLIAQRPLTLQSAKSVAERQAARALSTKRKTARRHSA